MNITLSYISTKDLAALSESVIYASKNGKYRIPENHQLLNDLEKEYAFYKQCYTKKPFSGMGKEVKRAYHHRQKIFSRIKQYLNSYRKMDLFADAPSAEALYQIIKHYGLNIGNINYSESLALLSMLIKDLHSEFYLQKIEALGLKPYLTELTNSNQQFEDLYYRQAQANAQIRRLPSATKARKQLEKALRNYFELLKLMQNIPQWHDLYIEINEIVKAVNG